MDFRSLPSLRLKCHFHISYTSLSNSSIFQIFKQFKLANVLLFARITALKNGFYVENIVFHYISYYLFRQANLPNFSPKLIHITTRNPAIYLKILKNQYIVIKHVTFLPYIEIHRVIPHIMWITCFP